MTTSRSNTLLPNVMGNRKDDALVTGVGNIVEEIRSYMDDWGAANVPYDRWFSAYLAPSSAKSGDDKSGTTSKGGMSKKVVRKSKLGRRFKGKKSKKKTSGKKLPPAPNRILPPPT